MAVLPVAPDQVAYVWEQVLLKVRDRLASTQAFDTWFRPIVALEFGPQSVDLEVPNAFFVDWIHEHHLTHLREAFSEVLGHCPDIRFAAREPSPPPAAARGARTPRKSLACRATCRTGGGAAVCFGDECQHPWTLAQDVERESVVDTGFGSSTIQSTVPGGAWERSTAGRGSIITRGPKTMSVSSLWNRPRLLAGDVVPSPSRRTQRLASTRCPYKERLTES